MADATPGEVRDVEETVDATEVDEGAVVGDVLDDALDDGAFLERFEELGAFFAHVGFNDGTAGNHDVVALAVELDNLEFEGLAFVRRRVLDRTGVHEGARRKARMPLVMTVRPPLTLPVTVPVTSSPDSRACSRFIQAARRLALSRLRIVSP